MGWCRSLRSIQVRGFGFRNLTPMLSCTSMSSNLSLQVRIIWARFSNTESIPRFAAGQVPPTGTAGEDLIYGRGSTQPDAV
ncbi:hypothetical protein MPTK1_4g00720 [Marchantia polymorpha subsp. ruderalis]|uniref:Uncharacterized protein n=2 Tax=Marchantia polymorpha TaxID=3197 RepID=A0AAF6B4Y6_MARPO|nr:hypothetical protein MARPO_0066s0070 [Marchantia polymorpha]BBN07070.1 hypothetical protein Mp_4g00720 [Marchantia polymorpha subsp. ruderalis]|eukprot:PTQ36114.1 hypothetical protein MARPO_0066s0070 [Marchantia polymorpha]